MNPSKFGFTDEEFILAINTLRKLDAPLGEKITPVVSMDEKLNVEHFDSLGIVVFFMWISQLFGISESKVQDFMEKGDFTVKAIKEFVTVEATRTHTYAEAEEYIKKCF
jgi:hypothetical protein|tara:strand:+ start:73 stop:399 length:327 start_codon:yes stop_codon:yes gene_type:complete